MSRNHTYQKLTAIMLFFNLTVVIGGRVLKRSITLFFCSIFIVLFPLAAVWAEGTGVPSATAVSTPPVVATGETSAVSSSPADSLAGSPADAIDSGTSVEGAVPSSEDSPEGAPESGEDSAQADSREKSPTNVMAKGRLVNHGWNHFAAARQRLKILEKKIANGTFNPPSFDQSAQLADFLGPLEMLSS
ncbi:MAG: hypothetical protein P1P74_06995 [Desulfuromonadales bacterium]|nr:hypothetical protein [Desulfuromonadales bacterium]